MGGHGGSESGDGGDGGGEGGRLKTDSGMESYCFVFSRKPAKYKENGRRLFSCTRMARTGLSPRITIGAPMLCSPSGDASATLGTWRWTLSQNTLLHAVHVQRALRRGRLL